MLADRYRYRCIHIYRCRCIYKLGYVRRYCLFRGGAAFLFVFLRTGGAEPDIKKLNQLLLSGSCCSQALVSLGLTLKGEENPSLLKASASLCLGVRSGLTCGALTGAAMMMALFEPEAAYSEMIPELADWFQENYGEIYGGSDCRSILGDNMANKALRCPQVVENTYRKARELLEDYGVDLADLAEMLENADD